MPETRWMERTFVRDCACGPAALLSQERETKPAGWVDRCAYCGAIVSVYYGCHAGADDDLPEEVAVWNLELMREDMQRHQET